MLRALIIALGLAPAVPAAAQECERITFDGLDHTICELDPATTTLRLFHADERGAPWGHFPRLDAALRREGKALGVAMNGGMYHDDRRPVGLYIEDGTEVQPVVTRAGPGNFGLLPNGVLCLSDGSASVVESRRFAEERPECRDASQSGPMLVIDGALHPRFLPDSTSRHIRNGVGVREDGTVVLAISDQPVTFHEFGRLFRDRLETPDALYLDGSVSRLWAPAIGRRDLGRAMGPILGTVVPAD
ncbi:phosphodiester glycosidase family protein [Roseitranquillus sediminis]|uniref:phosphodiester glycosidase family protein n=1 Tax=Roseitranquillus sediminis TaxID=2809051 RepID=UPI001D0CA518|nr:phosphodiester glycosidase family protein [Roseitranquillus sediminis]MBM9593679.1 phosphodiester glycosidase family protein [Roseitranquillus sediminis]